MHTGRKSELKPKKNVTIVDANDPIEVAIVARKAAGSSEAIIKKPEAIKKEILVPKALNLRLANVREVLLTLVNDEPKKGEKIVSKAKTE